MARFEMSAIDGLDLAGQGAAPDGLYELGLAYAIGRGVAADLVTAHKWFNIAAARGNRDALSYRRELSVEMTPAEIAEAQRQAREWMRTH
jgi:TPR repeat protein